MKQGTMSENQQNHKETYLKRLQLLELLDRDDRLYLLYLTFRTLGKIIICYFYTKYFIIYSRIK